MLERSLEAGHYPLGLDADLTQVRGVLGRQYRILVSHLQIPDRDKRQVVGSLYDHYLNVERIGLREHRMRLAGDPRANLVYHNFDHFVQTGFDGAAIATRVTRRNDRLSAHLSDEGRVAAAIASLIHDVGEITASPLLEFVREEDLHYTEEEFPTLAHHKPVHVAAGMDYLPKIVRQIGLPPSLDMGKVIELGIQGLHNTNFPWTEEREKERQLMLSEATPEQWKEAMLVRLIVQLADLAGQSIRNGQFPDGVKLLRTEENSIKPGSGTELLGTDEELLEKSLWFDRHVLIPKMGKSANALLGEGNVFVRAFTDFLDEPGLHQLSYGDLVRTVHPVKR